LKDIKTEGIDPVVEPVEDKVHRVVRAVINSVPVVGGVGVEIFNTLVEQPLEKRKLNWMLDVSASINCLIKQGQNTIERLQENERFISILMHSSQIAVRNHQESKLEALKNATLNSINEEALDESIMHIFVNMIDDFTPLHIQTLKYFEVHSVEFGCESSPVTLLHLEMKINDSLKKIVDDDLINKRLIELIDLKDEDPIYLKTWKPTQLGKDFLNFISEPNKEN
jgi:hypothetical protein